MVVVVIFPRIKMSSELFFFLEQWISCFEAKSIHHYGVGLTPPSILGDKAIHSSYFPSNSIILDRKHELSSFILGNIPCIFEMYFLGMLEIYLITFLYKEKTNLTHFYQFSLSEHSLLGYTALSVPEANKLLYNLQAKCYTYI